MDHALRSLVLAKHIKSNTGENSRLQSFGSMIVLAGASGAAMMMLTGPVAKAQNAQVEFSIEEQSLAGALLTYGEQADVSIAFPNDLVNGKQASPVSGIHSQADALRMILNGSGLTFEFVSLNSGIIPLTNQTH